MGIGAISGFSGISAISYNPNNYKINSVYGNPKSVNPIEKIGKEDYTGNPFAILSKDNEKEEEARVEVPKTFNYDAAMSRMMQGSRYNADNIPLATMV